METEYQFWNAPKSGETYAVEIINGMVSGVCGPLYYDEVKAEMLPHYDYRPVPEGFVAEEWKYDERTEEAR